MAGNSSKKSNMFICSSKSSKVAFISPTQKKLSDMLSEHFPQEYLPDVVMDRTDWKIYKREKRGQEGGDGNS